MRCRFLLKKTINHCKTYVREYFMNHSKREKIKEQNIPQQELKQDCQKVFKLGIGILASIVIVSLICVIFNMRILLFFILYCIVLLYFIAPISADIAVRLTYRICKLRKSFNIPIYDKTFFQGILGIFLCLLPILVTLFVTFILPCL